MKQSIVIILLLVAINLKSQIKITTGDAELDKALIELNNDAKNAIDVFKADVKDKFNVAAATIDNLLGIHKMEPSDVIMALEIAQITTKPVETVAVAYDKNKSKGWGEIAKEMGIKPGSKEFHALKDNAKGKSKSMKGKGKGNSGGNGKGHGKGKK